MPKAVLSIEVMEDGNWLGGSIYIDNLLAALSSLPDVEWPEVRLCFLSAPDTPFARRLLRHPVLRNARAGGLVGARLRRLHRAAIRRVPALAAIWRDRSGTVHFPAFDASQDWRRNLFWIPDFQPLHLPQLFSPQERDARQRAMAEIAGRDGILLLSSRAALADFRKFFPEARVQPRVWSFCSSLGSEMVDDAWFGAAELPEKFFYVANQFWRHKDHAVILKAMAILQRRGIIVNVVCTGQQNDRRDPRTFAEFMEQAEDLGVKGHLRLLGLVPREAQIALFRHATGVIQPSRFEGWSTVIEDAKALGRPVIASDLAVHVEQLRDEARHAFFALGDADALADRMAEAWARWPSGPDLPGERAAAERRDAARLRSAREFLAIIEQASRLHPEQN